MNVAINLNEYYNPTYKKNEPFKYHVAVLVSKIKVSLDQHIARDLVQFTTCSEQFSYQQQLKKYRPCTRIQSFIDIQNKNHGQGLSPDLQAKKKRCIQDWWKMALWYVRLKVASSKKRYHKDLLEAEINASTLMK